MVFIRPYNEVNLERDCFGGETSSDEWQNWQSQSLTNAYILLYEK